MFVGFDYGTSNCAMAHILDDKAQLISLYPENYFVPSALYALDRSFIASAIWQGLPESDKTLFANSRAVLLRQARSAFQDYSFNNISDGMFFGHEAIEHYMAAPNEGYFIKSPKSFLGASGLRQESVDFFEDVVAAMMINVKKRAEKILDNNITQVVIGRPVNFQGVDAQLSNQQAQAILLTAGKRAGFKDVEFLYEPLAAGFDFETRLNADKCVLVVDVGGGTTDCSFVMMGPSYIKKIDRKKDFLGHSGERIGGNDFDIQFAQKLLMPNFGIHSLLKNGLPMPKMPYVNAMAINDVGAQAEFYNQNTTFLIEKLMRETTQPELLKRLQVMRNNKHNFAVVREAENGKIALSSQISCDIHLDFIERELISHCSAKEFSQSVECLLDKIVALIKSVCQQAAIQPDVIYLTGGSAKSPLIQAAIRELFGDTIAIVDGDHFGSVVAGLSLWAQRVYT